ncbi:unnamed protein product [Lactuca saligna]|uniref:Uncharacterized protein n=1 Tax=Lactuca saligna TaxID=75948 RepID=A0AA36ELP2_LACSI|nr:unnamed protein product [Lactuca saligna]
MINGTNTSDFGYDSSTHSIPVEASIWDVYIQVHKEVGKWRNKIFPHYEDLCIIFGNDRVQGNKANDFTQMEEDANAEEQTKQIEDDFEEQVTESEELASSLSALDRFKASRKIMRDPGTVLIFRKLEEQDREDFVKFYIGRVIRA